MNILLTGFVFVVIFALSNISVYHVANGQYFGSTNKTLYFERIEFDAVNRGAFNTSSCLNEILNCWEFMKPDILCSYGKFKDFCGFLKDKCHDYYGRLQHRWAGRFSLYPSICQDDDNYQQWTK